MIALANKEDQGLLFTIFQWRKVYLREIGKNDKNWQNSSENFLQKWRKYIRLIEFSVKLQYLQGFQIKVEHRHLIQFSTFIENILLVEITLN